MKECRAGGHLAGPGVFPFKNLRGPPGSQRGWTSRSTGLVSAPRKDPAEPAELCRKVLTNRWPSHVLAAISHARFRIDEKEKKKAQLVKSDRHLNVPHNQNQVLSLKPVFAGTFCLTSRQPAGFTFSSSQFPPGLRRKRLAGCIYRNCRDVSKTGSDRKSCRSRGGASTDGTGSQMAAEMTRSAAFERQVRGRPVAFEASSSPLIVRFEQAALYEILPLTYARNKSNKGFTGEEK